MTWLHVLIVPLQGIYDGNTGRFYCEYPDRDVYVRHLLGLPAAVREWGCNCISLSGGPTQAAAPHLTEAQGALALLRDLEIRIPLESERIIIEPHALDSAENVILSLMVVRIAFPRAAFGRIVIWPAWAFKKPRFTALARALGIAEQCYVCGGAQAVAANDGCGAETGERTQLDRMTLENDLLLIADHWERKRAARYQGDGYITCAAWIRFGTASPRVSTSWIGCAPRAHQAGF